MAEEQTATPPDPNQTVSVERDGRVLSGVGASVADLEAIMDRHTPAPEAAADEAAPVLVTPDQAAPSPKPTKGQARFAELHAKAEAAEARVRELEAKLTSPAATPTPAAAPAEPVRPVAQPVAQAPTRPEPTEDDIGTKYQTYKDFTRDQAQWVFEQQQQAIAERIRAEIRADQQAQQVVQAYQASAQKMRAEAADFESALKAPHMAAPWQPEKLQIIASLPDPARVQYHLAKHPDLAEALRLEQDPVRFGMALQTILASTPRTPAVSPASTGRPPFTAPAPMQPVGATSPTTTSSPEEFAQRGDYAGYKAARAAQRRRAG